MAIVWTRERKELQRVLDNLPRALAGRVPDRGRLARGVMLAMGVSLLADAKANFIELSRGNPGIDGTKWKPLSPYTKAARLRKTARAAFLRSKGIKGRRERGLLTPAQNAKWKRIFGAMFRKFVGDYSVGEAKAKAAQIAWAALKRDGALLVKNVFADAPADILVDTGRLLASITPGYIGPSGYLPPRGAKRGDHVMDIQPGRVIVGTNVEYAQKQHKHRPFWPAEIPNQWAQNCATAAAGAVATYMGAYLGQQP